jgi:starch synthase
MRVVMLASEAHPWAKTGGLGDVLAALPQALARAGLDVTVCLPGYRSALARAGATVAGAGDRAPVSSRMEPFEPLRVRDAPVPTVLLRADRYFDRDGLYGSRAVDYADNAERFAFFCRAALEWLRHQPSPPDIVHVHDWQGALVPAFLRTSPELYPELRRTRTVLTIHNLAYQGRFPAAAWHVLNLDPRFFTPAYLEFWGDVSFLKAGIVFADAITTVSPRYATEILTPELGEGLDGVLRTRQSRLRGILNGIDDVEWDPATDRHLPARYDRHDLRGKATCKSALQDELGLDVDAGAALLGVVTRLVEQKGVDLLLATLPDVLRAGGVQLAVLGSGGGEYRRRLGALAGELPGRVALRTGMDEGLAHRIEAGADVFLMPSRFEPCGLSQLYSLRYGTVPVVHATGGLDDTVVELDPATGSGTGFKFTPYTPEAFRAALARAFTARRRPAVWTRLVANGMAEDFSWDRAAREYVRCYEG